MLSKLMLLNCGWRRFLSPLDCKDIKPVNPKGNQFWIFIGRTDAEAETLIFWPSDVKNWLIWKDPDAGKDWRQEEKGRTEDERIGCHHWLDGHEFEQTLGVCDGQRSLACCSPWGWKDLDMTEWLDWMTELTDWLWCQLFEMKIMYYYIWKNRKVLHVIIEYLVWSELFLEVAVEL